MSFSLNAKIKIFTKKGINPQIEQLLSPAEYILTMLPLYFKYTSLPVSDTLTDTDTHAIRAQFVCHTPDGISNVL